jgi:hypothetical protein
LESLHQDYKRQSLLGINQGVFNRVLTHMEPKNKKHRLFCLTVFLLIFVSNKKYFDAKQSEK